MVVSFLKCPTECRNGDYRPFALRVNAKAVP